MTDAISPEDAELLDQFMRDSEHLETRGPSSPTDNCLHTLRRAIKLLEELEDKAARNR